MNQYKFEKNIWTIKENRDGYYLFVKDRSAKTHIKSITEMMTAALVVDSFNVEHSKFEKKHRIINLFGNLIFNDNRLT